MRSPQERARSSSRKAAEKGRWESFAAPPTDALFDQVANIGRQWLHGKAFGAELNLHFDLKPRGAPQWYPPQRGRTNGPVDAPVLYFPPRLSPKAHQPGGHPDRAFSKAGSVGNSPLTSAAIAGSSKPQEVAAYTPDKLIGDIFLLADALGIGSFTIVPATTGARGGGKFWPPPCLGGAPPGWGGPPAPPGRGAPPQHIRGEPCDHRHAPHPAIFQKLL